MSRQSSWIVIINEISFEEFGFTDGCVSNDDYFDVGFVGCIVGELFVGRRGGGVMMVEIIVDDFL